MVGCVERFVAVVAIGYGRHDRRTLRVAPRPIRLRAMRAVTFQAPEQVRVEEKPDPELVAADDALVAVEASGVCGSDLHIYHGRVPVEPGFTIGHEFVGTVLAAGDDVEPGRRRRPRRRLLPHRLRHLLLLPARRLPPLPQRPDLRPRRPPRQPPGRPGRAAAGAAREPDPAPGAGGDVSRRRPLRRRRDGHRLPRGRPRRDEGRRHRRRARPRPGRPLRGAGALAGGAVQVFAIDTVEERLAMAGAFGATPLHLTEQDPKKEVRAATGGPASTSSSTRSATRSRWRWRSASPATPAPSPGSAPTRAGARSRSGSPG